VPSVWWEVPGRVSVIFSSSASSSSTSPPLILGTRPSYFFHHNIPPIRTAREKPRATFVCQLSVVPLSGLSGSFIRSCNVQCVTVQQRIKEFFSHIWYKPGNNQLFCFLFGSHRSATVMFSLFVKYATNSSSSTERTSRHWPIIQKFCYIRDGHICASVTSSRARYKSCLVCQLYTVVVVYDKVSSWL